MPLSAIAEPNEPLIVAADSRGRDSNEADPPAAPEVEASEEAGEEVPLGAVPVSETVTVIEPAEEAKQIAPLQTPLRWGPHEEKAAQERDRLLQQVGHLHDESGVRTEAVDRFYDALGLRPTGDYLIADEAHEREIGSTMKKLGHDYTPGDHYNTRLGMSFTFRQPGQNPTAVEIAHGHERGHATIGVFPPEPVLRQLFRGVITPYPGRLRGTSKRVSCGFSMPLGRRY